MALLFLLLGGAGSYIFHIVAFGELHFCQWLLHCSAQDSRWFNSGVCGTGPGKATASKETFKRFRGSCLSCASVEP